MTPESRAFIVRCFCGNVSAAEVAAVVNKTFDLHGHVVTSSAVHRIWNEERKTNTMIRLLEDELGERPVRGYRPCERTRLAERLVAV